MADQAFSSGPSGGFGTTFDTPEPGSEFGNKLPSSGFLPPTPTSASSTPTSAYDFTPTAPGFGTISNTAFVTEAPTSSVIDPTEDAVSAPDDDTCVMDIDDVQADSTFGMGAGHYPAPAQASTFGVFPNASFGATPFASGCGAPTAGAFIAPSAGTFSISVAP